MRTSEQRSTLWSASAATALTLVTFVTPQATVGRMVASFGADPAASAWLLSAMPLGLAVALLPAGALADDRGRRRVFTGGLTVLAVGALVCAVAGGPLWFVVGRLVQGVGGGAVLACGLGLLAHVFPAGQPRTRASGVWGASIGGGIAVGGFLTVLLDPGDGWRVSYAAVAVLAGVLAVAARAVLPESSAGPAGRPDLLGAALPGAGVACLLGGLVQTRQGGVRAPVLVLWAAAAVLLAAFAVAERRVATPMLDLALFRRRAFLAVTAAAVANGAGGTALVSYLPTMLQAGLGRSLLDTCWLTLLFAGTSVLTALAARRLPERLPSWLLLAGSLLGVAVGQVALAGVTTGSTVLRLLPGLLVGGLAYGVLNAVLGREAVASVPEGRASVGSGANNTARYIASAVAITAVALLATRDSAAGPSGVVARWNDAVLVTAAVSVAGALVVTALRPRAGGPSRRPTSA